MSRSRESFPSTNVETLQTNEIAGETFNRDDAKARGAKMLDLSTIKDAPNSIEEKVEEELEFSPREQEELKVRLEAEERARIEAEEEEYQRQVEIKEQG